MAPAIAGLKGATKGAAFTATCATSLGIIFRTNFLNLLPSPKFSLLRGTDDIPPSLYNCRGICILFIIIMLVNFF